MNAVHMQCKQIGIMNFQAFISCQSNNFIIILLQRCCLFHVFSVATMRRTA